MIVSQLLSIVKFCVATTDSGFCNSSPLPLSVTSKKDSLSLSVIAKCALPEKLVSLSLTLRLLFVMSSVPS